MEIAAEGVVVGYGERKANFHGLGRRVGNRYTPFRPVVCIQACRTPYGAFGGSLKAFSAPELGALAIQEVLRRAAGQIVPEEVDYVFMGQVVTAGSGQHPARQAAMLGGLPASVPAVTLNKVCASAMKTLDLGAQMIQLKRAEVVIAGGQESMSSAPYLLPDMRWGARMGVPTGRVLDAMVFDGLWDAFHERHMALHGSEAADEFGIGRQEQDEWACRSQQAAHLARSQGRLDEEIFPILVQRGKEQVVFDRDEGLRPASTPEVLAGLPSVFNHLSAVTGRSGSVTAGNAPGVSDGADVCLLMSGEMAAQRSVTPLFTLLDYAEVSSAPRDIAVVPGLAIRKILEQNDFPWNKWISWRSTRPSLQWFSSARGRFWACPGRRWNARSTSTGAPSPMAIPSVPAAPG
jgi:acetyl-CoA C-acetyltransferase